MPGKKQGQGKMQEEAELSVQMTTSELETLVNLQAAFEKIEPGTSEVDVSYEQAPDDMIVEEVHDSADPLLQGVVLGSSAEGEVITGDVEEDTVTVEAEEEQEDQPTYLFVQHSEGQSGNSGFTEARTADGSIVQLRQITSSNTIQGLQGLKPLQPSGVKRQAQSSNQQVTKVIISGNNSSSSPQMVLTSSPSTSQTVRLVTTSSAGTSGTTSLPSNSRTITLAQAQQMGLIASPKVQISSSPQQSKQNIIINKIASPTKTSSPRITMVQQGVKSPTKILPAPGGAGLLRPAVASVAQMNTPGGHVKQLVAGPQKIIIRQAGSSFQTALKQGTILTGSPGSGGQIIRIPATQNIVSGVGENQAVQIQQGRQVPVQYLRLVSSPQSSSSSPTKATMVKQQIAPAPVKMVPIAPATSGATGIRSVAPKTQGSIMTQKIMIPTASSSNTTAQQVRQVSQMTPVGSVTPAAVTQLGGTLVPTAGGNFMVLPAQIYDQLQATPRTPITPITPVTPAPVPEVKMKEKTTPRLVDTTPRSANRVTLDTNGIRPRKPCNCTKSQCLKLYCDCFANGEFCNNCNCNTCYNNLEHEEERQKAIRACLERNPQAFKPKIGKTQVGDERRHNKGCNCRRSGCLKNYCECYEAKIPCTHMCKCIGCRNLEDSEERRLDRENVVLAAGLRARQQHLYAANRSRMASGKRGRGAATAAMHGLVRQPFGFMNQRLVEATCECLLAQAKQGEDAREEGEAEEGEGAGPDETEIERRVLEEYGACLKQFIECSTKQDISL